MVQRSYCWLILRACATGLCTMLCTVPREIRKSKTSRSNSTTPRVELWQMNTKARTSCRSQDLVTGR